MDAAGESSGEAPSQACSLSPAAEQHIAMKLAGAGLLAQKKGGSNLYALGSEGKSRDDSPRIGDAAGGKDRHRDGVSDLRY